MQRGAGQEEHEMAQRQNVCVSACLCVCVHVCIYLCSLVPDYALGERLRERGRIQVAMET